MRWAWRWAPAPRSAAVRRGAAQASVAASFDLPKDHPAHAILAEQALDDEDVLTLRRLVGADGRGRAFVNDQPASVALLRRLGDTLVEIQGQMEQHGLLDMATHRASLDAFAGLDKQGEAVRAAWHAWRAAEQARTDAEAAAAAARRDEDFLRHAVKELEALAPKPDDEETLAAERQMLRAGSALGEAVAQALAELEQGRGAVTALSTAHRLIERNADKALGRLDAALAALDRALSEATEAQAQLEAARDALEFDPARLEKIEERLFALRAAARKHNVAVAELAPLAEKMTAQLAALDDGEAGLKKLAAAAKAARAAIVAAAEAQSAARRKGAARLDKAVAAELGPLKLEKAKFVTDLAALPEAEWSEAGTDRVQFTVATNPGTPPAPIAKIASGGELSRFLLALKVVAGQGGRRRDHRVRRGRFGHRRRHGRGGGRAAEAAGQGGPGAGRHPFAAGRGGRRPALADPQDHDQECRQHRRAGARRQGPPRGDRAHAVGRRGDGRGARRRRPPAGGGGLGGRDVACRQGRCRPSRSTR